MARSTAASLASGGLLALAIAMADPLAGAEQIEEVLVVGRQPGPPLWRVFDGDHVLWIFPLVSPLPRDMVWESDRVAEVLAKSDEVLGEPDVDFSVAVGVRMNPINLFRGMRLARRVTRNPDGKTLAEVLPAELYRRFSALKARYLPNDEKLEQLRPLVAGDELLDRAQAQAGLVSGDAVSRQLDRLIRKTRGVRRTDIVLDERLEGSFGQLSARLERLVDSFTAEQELACFENQLARAEGQIEPMKSRANAWAQGYVDEFRDTPLPGSDDDPCMQLLYASSETQTLEALRSRLGERWLDHAVRALTDNANTFAILDIDELVADDGLLAQLRAMGYRVEEP